ncbi:helix-turn-helix domain-containing protein [Rhodococcus indonesiensis]
MPHTSATDTLEQWTTTVHTHFPYLEVDAHDGFAAAKLTTWDGALASAGMVVAPRHTVRRNRRHIASCPSGSIKTVVPLTGACTLRQHERTISIPTGRAVVYDADHPYVLTLTEGSRILVLLSPRRFVGQPTSGLVSLTPSVRSLVRSLTLGLSLPADIADRASLDVDLPAVTAAALAAAEDGTDPRAVLCGRIVEYIEQHLPEPDLTPDRIAAALFVSRRTLYNAVARYELSVSQWIRTRRLQRCREDLIDPRCANRSVREIGAAWGFADPAYFSHAFKSEYGMSPAQWRRTTSA